MNQRLSVDHVMHVSYIWDDVEEGVEDHLGTPIEILWIDPLRLKEGRDGPLEEEKAEKPRTPMACSLNPSNVVEVLKIWLVDKRLRPIDLRARCVSTGD